MYFSTFLATVMAATIAIAHPGHDHHQEIAERRFSLQHNSRSDLSHCAAKMRARGLEARAVRRRAARAAALAKKGSLKARDLDTVLATSHLSTDGFTLNTDGSTLFASNGSCVLSPEVTQGPYYVAGEYIRTDITDDEEGVPLHLEAQVLDIDTCDPIANAYVEIWHCNSTGVYSGIVASGNGDSSDASNLDKTFLRGVQQTDSEGVVQFDSTFPGHYTSRTTHIHVMVHLNATPLANGTLMDLTAAHVGQMFFDQDLITQVEATGVYATNTQQLTTNEEDSILSEMAESSDPVMSYTLLGDSVEDGILSWLAFGINTTLAKTITPAAYLFESGGEAN